jgi:ribosomal protein L37E
VAKKAAKALTRCPGCGSQYLDAKLGVCSGCLIHRHKRIALVPCARVVRTIDAKLANVEAYRPAKSRARKGED